MEAFRAPYMAKTDKERLATGFWNRIESNQATDCNTSVRRAGFPTVETILRAGSALTASSRLLTWNRDTRTSYIFVFYRGRRIRQAATYISSTRKSWSCNAPVFVSTKSAMTF